LTIFSGAKRTKFWAVGFINCGSILAAISVLALVVACSGAPSAGTPLPATPQFSAVIATTDHAVGPNRIVFGVIDRDGMPVRGEVVQVRIRYLPPGQPPGEAGSWVPADFIPWPVGPQGVFKTTLSFDTPGFWQMEVGFSAPDGADASAVSTVEVKSESATPGLDQPAPPSVTPVGDQVDDLATITSSPVPDPDLYRLSIHEALQEAKPLVVAFATPAFCVTAVCGPQVAVLSQLKDRFPERANFIHVEAFENPHLITGGRPAGGFAPAVTEWNLPTEPWTFVVNSEGMVHAKFEAFTTLEELQASLEEVISP
jgi:hypothetical protein